jgi:hypothetical protein
MFSFRYDLARQGNSMFSCYYSALPGDSMFFMELAGKIEGQASGGEPARCLAFDFSAAFGDGCADVQVS